MHAPVGYEMADGRAQMNDFWAIIQNPQLWVQFPHTITAAMATGAYFIAGVSAWKITKRQETEMFKSLSASQLSLEQLQQLLCCSLGMLKRNI